MAKMGGGTMRSLEEWGSDPRDAHRHLGGGGIKRHRTIDLKGITEDERCKFFLILLEKIHAIHDKNTDILNF